MQVRPNMVFLVANRRVKLKNLPLGGNKGWKQLLMPHRLRSTRRNPAMEGHTSD